MRMSSHLLLMLLLAATIAAPPLCAGQASVVFKIRATAGEYDRTQTPVHVILRVPAGWLLDSTSTLIGSGGNRVPSQLTPRLRAD